jgi:hypothetical protein
MNRTLSQKLLDFRIRRVEKKLKKLAVLEGELDDSILNLLLEDNWQDYQDRIEKLEQKVGQIQQRAIILLVTKIRLELQKQNQCFAH